jgi:long-chain-fatty-acid--CoA ligase ACSBG
MIMQEIPEMGQHLEHLISYLPLSHVAAQMIDIHGPLMLAANFKHPATVWFARPDALRGTLRDTLLAARPTMFFGVPRVWEKFREALLRARRGGVLGAIGDWAKSVASEKFLASQLGSDAEPPLAFPVAKLLLNKVRAALGLDRCRYCLSGAAPITTETLDYFGSLDIPIHQVYGMSECTGPATLDLPDRTKNGSVGPALPGIEIKLDHVEGRDKPNEGEICYRGRNVMMGYMKNEEKTAESIDQDGWLHSGDVGRFDENGFVFITGRIKELIITAGGENIAPVPIEGDIKKLLAGLSNVMMVGDRRKFCSMLVTLQTEPIPETGTFSDKLAGEALQVDPSCITVKDAQKSEVWTRYIERGRTTYNNEIAVSNAQKLQKFVILDTDFSVAEGDLTPTLKLKRSVVAEKYANEIDSMYV